MDRAEKISRWDKSKSATDMINTAIVNSAFEGVQQEAGYLETLSKELNMAIDYFRGLEIDGVRCEQRKTTIDFLISADSEIHLQIIELKRALKRMG